MFLLGKIKMLLILTVVIGAVGFGAWKYYQYTQEQIRIYAVNAATAELAQQQAEAAVESLKRDMVEIQAQFTAVSSKFEVAKGRVDALEDKLSEHEIGDLAQKKPKLIEKIIDKGTKDVLRCYEILTGSPLTEDEIAVTKKSKANTTCSDVANPNYRP
jgi:predicted negative regulator of RcsB-dependent stress response|tara:strand:+ start:2054 stop:2527 length:474 start_codon:yes stop_codon:yes gene_type:complete